MKLYNRETDKVFTLSDIKKMIIPPFDVFTILYCILQASYQKENDISVIGVTRDELQRIITRLYDKHNCIYYG